MFVAFVWEMRNRALILLKLAILMSPLLGPSLVYSSESDFLEKLDRRARSIQLEKFEEDGPNCFNTTLRAVGAIETKAYTDGQDIENFIKGRPLATPGLKSSGQKFICRSVDAQSGEMIKPGDMGVITYYDQTGPARPPDGPKSPAHCDKNVSY